MVADADFFPEGRLALPQVTLCAVSSVNVQATLRALKACLEQVSFASCKLLTDAAARPDHPEIQVIPINRICSAAEYSKFMLSELVEHVETSHCLVVQWDGHILDAQRWRPEFLDFDYIGASWPQFDDAHNVGNGGFSLRSRRLMEWCRSERFQAFHPEDVAICRTNRLLLEQEGGMVFADQSIADLFAFERKMPADPTFGFHGIFNMIPALGVERFWEIYRTLEDRSTAVTDYRLLMVQLGIGKGVWSRRAQLTIDIVKGLFR